MVAIFSENIATKLTLITACTQIKQFVFSVEARVLEVIEKDKKCYQSVIDTISQFGLLCELLQLLMEGLQCSKAPMDRVTFTPHCHSWR